LALEILSEESLIDFSLEHFQEIRKNRAKNKPTPSPQEESKTKTVSD